MGVYTIQNKTVISDVSVTRTNHTLKHNHNILLECLNNDNF